MTNLGAVGAARATLMEDKAGEWFTAAELADMGLPTMPNDKRAVNRRARDERWHLRNGPAGEPLSRPRAGRGGGTEYHVSLLPGAARLELARRSGTSDAEAAAEPAGSGLWRSFETASAKAREEAQRRLGIIQEIDLLLRSSVTATAAIADVAPRHNVSSSTLWGWLKLIEGVARQDWLPALAPRHRGGGKEAEIDPFLWTFFKSDYLRPSEPTLTSCYHRTAAKAAELGLSMPSEKTFRRRFERDLHPDIVLRRRKGEEALRRSIPAEKRDVSELHALECVNIDGHKFDVFVTPPGGGKPIRPIMVAIQDVYSSKVLAWRLDLSESAMLTRLAFADLFSKYGIPKHCVLDNGRAFASKWITGGAASRYRFKIREEEPTGIITAFGIEIHWALPYRGQSKPIERAWRDLASDISRAPEMHGAYVGNKPTAKPENYGSRAIPWDEFVGHVSRGIDWHNARLGRTGRHYRNRSFDEVFAESYAQAPIGKATPEQLRMALLAADQVRVDRRTSLLTIFGNRYWSPSCAHLRGQLVTVRYDPDDLRQDVHLYDQGGKYLTSAQMLENSGFLDADGAIRSAKRVAAHKKTIRAGIEAEQLLAAEELARLRPDAPIALLPEPKVTRLVRHRGRAGGALPKPHEAPAVDPRVEEFNRIAQRAALRVID